MKVLQRILISLSLFFIFSSAYAQNGTATMASITDPIVLSVAEDTLYEKWNIDISSLGFSTEADAKKFFDMRTDNLLHFEIMWTEERVVLILSLTNQNNWNLREWTTYVHDKTS